MLKLRMWSHGIQQSLKLKLSRFLDKDRITSTREDEAKLDALLHYPIKPAAIPLIGVESLYERHKDKIIQIQSNIGLVKSGSKYNSTEMVGVIIKNFMGYCHLLPASEMDHHQYVGELLEHSLDVSLRSLQSAIGSMLDEQGLIDEDQIRRPRYEYAAWLCGLLHDAGKIISNLKIIEPKTGQQWQPLHSNLFDWGVHKSFSEYTVLHKKNRIHNEHETNSIHFLSLILNETTKDYLLSGPDDLYSKVTQTLIGYHSNKGYLHNAVRLADGASTYNDYARVWRHDSHRDKAMVTAVVDVLRSLYFDWTVNNPNAEMFILNGEVYLDMNKPVKAVINKCQELRIAVPNSPKSLIEILIEKRIIGKVSDKSTFGNFYCGKFSEEDIHKFNESKSGPLASTSPKSVIKFVWANFAIGDNPIPDNAKGALRYNTKKQDNVHTLFNGDKAIVVNQKPASSKESIAQPATSSTLSPAASQTAVPSPAASTITDDELDAQSEPETLDTNKELPTPTRVKKRKPRAMTKAADVNNQSSAGEKTLVTPLPTVDSQSGALINGQANNSSTQPVIDQAPPSNYKSKTEGSSDTPHVKREHTETMGISVDVAVPTWVNNRAIKDVDKALWELVLIQNTEHVVIESGCVVVSVKYLAERTQQTLKSTHQELEYLGLIKSAASVDIAKKIIINGVSTKIAALSNDVANEFSYLSSVAINEMLPVTVEPVIDGMAHSTTLFNETEPQQMTLPSERVTDEVPIHSESNENVSTTTILPIVESIQPEISHELPDESPYLTQPLSIFVSSLQESYPSVSVSNLRPYFKTLQIKPTMDQKGALLVSTNQVQRDELNYKIQQGITDDK